jgi:hypothetical protein
MLPVGFSGIQSRECDETDDGGAALGLPGD